MNYLEKEREEREEELYGGRHAGNGWGHQVNRNDVRIHYFADGISVCGKKTGGGYMSTTPYYPKCVTCARILLNPAPKIE